MIYQGVSFAGAATAHCSGRHQCRQIPAQSGPKEKVEQGLRWKRRGKVCLWRQPDEELLEVPAIVAAWSWFDEPTGDVAETVVVNDWDHVPIIVILETNFKNFSMKNSRGFVGFVKEFQFGVDFPT